MNQNLISNRSLKFDSLDFPNEIIALLHTPLQRRVRINATTPVDLSQTFGFPIMCLQFTRIQGNQKGPSCKIKVEGCSLGNLLPELSWSYHLDE